MNQDKKICGHIYFKTPIGIYGVSHLSNVQSQKYVVTVFIHTVENSNFPQEQVIISRGVAVKSPYDDFAFPEAISAAKRRAKRASLGRKMKVFKRENALETLIKCEGPMKHGELFFHPTKRTHDPEFHEVAIVHGLQTAKNLIRDALINGGGYTSAILKMARR